MTDIEYKNLKVQAELISDYITNINIDIDNLYHNDITMTEDDKNKMVEDVRTNSIKLWFAFEDFAKQLKKFVGGDVAE